MTVSAITAVDDAFSVLTCRPAPLVFDARDLPHLNLPQPTLPLDELRALLVRRTVRGPAVDEIWRRLALAARLWGPEWVVGAVGMAVPGLRALAARLTVGRPHLGEDIDSEVVLGFLTALRAEDLDGPRLWLRLSWAAWRNGHLATRERETCELPGDLANNSSTPPAPYGHPDLLLGRAVAGGVLTTEEAELIGSTRLGGVLIESLVSQGETSAAALRMRRVRAEHRLVHALEQGRLSNIAIRADKPQAPTGQRRRGGPNPNAVRTGVPRGSDA